MRRSWLALFGLVAVVELVGVALDSTVLQWLAKPLLAPVLLAYLLQHRRRVDAVAAGLVAATTGDVALLVPGRTAFLVGMGFFLVAQLAFLAGFRRRGRPPVLAWAGYLLAWAVGNALLWGALGPLRLPVLGYSLALCLMAAAATGVSARVGAGGAFFLVSDLLIGVGAAGTELPGAGLLVMTTYCAALLLITTGWVAASPPAAGRPAGERPVAGRVAAG
ncbi:lysoplasmalogenase [Micromonospora sp. NPDC049282]|uniref:lysoplasmalogenase n=1 Tax=Micromonospora sp. NPDC049282 TaxID=3364269 RepID=UPI00371F6455